MSYQVLNTHELIQRSGLVADQVPLAELITAALDNQKSERGMVFVAVVPQDDDNLYIFRHETD